MKRQGNRYCKNCQTKLQKNGWENGKQRWRCPGCGQSRRLHRPDLTSRYHLRKFVKYIINTQSQKEQAIRPSRIAISPQVIDETGYLSISLWSINPTPVVSGEIYSYLVIDAKPVGQGTCAIVRDKRFVRYWRHGIQENSALWLSTLEKLARPGGVVCDGQSGIAKALGDIWPGIVIQRCQVHVKRNIRQKLTLRPQSRAGQDLQWLVSQLSQVNDETAMALWIAVFDSLHEEHIGFLKQRTYASVHSHSDDANRLKKVWWYTHRSVRSAYRQIDKLIADDQLFAFITHPELKLPATTNLVEGGINSRLSELLRRHRGMTSEHQKRLVDWYLDSRTEWPYF